MSEETGYLKDISEDNPAGTLVQKGSYSYETPDGQVFYGQSGPGEPPDAALLRILTDHVNNFGCAEVSCLNQALRANPDALQGSSITSLKLRGPASDPSIKFQPPCEGGCDILLHELGVTVVGGP